MTSSNQNDGVLCSDADGTYDVSFFAASVSHSLETSRRVFGSFPGKTFSANGKYWRRTAACDRKIYLLEHHEIAHHALMFSTPAGALIWRLNQMIARDVGYIFKECQAHDIVFPVLGSPMEMLTSPDWQRAFFPSLDIPNAERKLYFLYVVGGLNQMMELRSILIGGGVAYRYSHLTVGQFVALLNSTYRYISDRCDCHFVKTWQTRLPPDELVFPPGFQFNMTDIAECHAVAAELYVLRAVNDKESFQARTSQFRSGPFGTAFGNVSVRAATKDVFNFSPHFVQLAALMAFCGAVDNASPGDSDLYVEDEFPWWRFRNESFRSASTIAQAFQTLGQWNTRPLFGPNSNWLEFHDVPESVDPTWTQKFFRTLASFGLDLQVYSIHQGAGLNYRFLVTAMHEAAQTSLPLPVEKLDSFEWSKRMFLSVPLIEYSDGFYFREFPLSNIYPTTHPLRKFTFFEKFKHLPFQLLAHLVNGIFARNSFGEYAGRQVPRIEIIRSKLASVGMSNDETAAFCGLLTNNFEAHYPRLKLVDHGRFI